jgi:hypothetical protein
MSWMFVRGVAQGRLSKAPQRALCSRINQKLPLAGWRECREFRPGQAHRLRGIEDPELGREYGWATGTLRCADPAESLVNVLISTRI